MNWNSNWGNSPTAEVFTPQPQYNIDTLTAGITPQNVHPEFAAQPETQAEPAKLDDPLSDAMKARLEAERLPVTPDGVLMLWQRTQDILRKAKEDEMEIRKTAVKVYVPKADEGTNNVDMGNGYTLKAVVKFNYNLDSDNAKVEAALDRIAALGNQGPFIADRLVKWSASFLLTEYRTLQADAPTSAFAQQALSIINEVLTITDAAPTLEIKEPKAKKK